MESSQVHSSDTETRTNGDDTCLLRFLMINGESFRMPFPTDTSVEEVKKHITDNPPRGMFDINYFLFILISKLIQSCANIFYILF